VALDQGDRLGRYRIVGPLGAGGMGEVWRAHDERLGRDVAIKVLPAEFAADPERLKRFEREARATAALSHPNILAVHDVGTHEGVPFLVEELLEGESLRERLERGPLDQAEALRIAAEIGRGLAAAHAKGIVHRDLKPGNVFLTRDGAVKILDFGLARLVVMAGTPETLAEAATAAESTQLGAVLGTVAYMAPEQARGQPVDQRADVFAFGVVLYEMLSGTRPFQGLTATDTLAAILKDEPPPLPAAVPPAVAVVVTGCLAKDPDKRYQRGSELRAALETVESGVAVSPALSWLAARLRRRLLVAAAMAVAAVAVVVALDPGGVRTRMLGGHGGAARSIKLAVLPFANLSGDPEQEYLSDGLTQEMIAQLGRLHPGSLSVIARTSVMRYKKSEAPIDQIGRELGVDYVLEGSAQREAGRIRISAELIQVRDQTQLWADVYEREISGILALQGDVAQKVAAALALKLLPAEQARLAKARAVNPEAYEAYLKGSYHWKKLTPADVDTAQRYFELALAKDPSYAPAYEGLSTVWTVRQQVGVTAPHEAGPKAKEAALRAIALDDGSAEAHTALAMVKTWTEWDWAGAEPEWRRALELDPNAANTHAYFAWFLAINGRMDEAVRHSEQALELDPFNALFHALHAKTLYFDRRYDQALSAAQTALAMQPEEQIARTVLQYVLIAKGMRDELLANQRERIARDPERVAAFEQGLAESGYEGVQRRIADLLAARYQNSGGVPDPGVVRVYMPCAIATRYLDAGDHERAIDWLETGFEIRDPHMTDIGQPLYDPLRRDPRFQRLLGRMNLPVD
jgi:eukaryotic-like serine/threonine-protein kinase